MSDCIFNGTAKEAAPGTRRKLLLLLIGRSLRRRPSSFLGRSRLIRDTRASQRAGQRFRGRRKILRSDDMESAKKGEENPELNGGNSLNLQSESEESKQPGFLKEKARSRG